MDSDVRESSDFLDSNWMLFGREMFRESERMRHHFRCAAGEIHFSWTKHLMHVSVIDYCRLRIAKGTAEKQEKGFARFAVGLYGPDNSLLESCVLTIDSNKMCRLTKGEKRVPVRKMCGRLLNILCTPSANPTLMLRVPE